ncbi:hypothetical protein ATG66_0957 [Vibrio sp. ES.051]|uniref:hypothetical protein n=1 Tax=Vibrio sp. ES.051 TaxID=1761909 RepID=UPI000BF599DE|nr:hypothetical protein [Vibrio sp. ES.051]PFG58407.1 hypothetical protein ATG66_0957 [Vibrio sp. ES.051]
MDNPKTYILVFGGLSALLLLLLIWGKPTNEETVSATVLSNTLTDSLDGQRRYLTINASEIKQQRVIVPISASCPVGSTATFHQTTSSSFYQSLSFVSCN